MPAFFCPCFVQTPPSHASWITATSACSEVLRASKKPGNIRLAAASSLSGSISPAGCAERGCDSRCARLCAAGPVHGARRQSGHPSLSVIRCRTASLRLRVANPANHAFAEARLAPWWSWSSRSPCGSWLRQAPSRPYRMAIPTLLEICRVNHVDLVALDGTCCGAHRKSMATC